MNADQQSKGAAVSAQTAPSFESLMLQLASAVGDGAEPLALIEDFCSLARQAFDVDGVYVWRRDGDGLTGVAAAADIASDFVGLHIENNEPAAAVDVVRTRQLVQVDDVAAKYPTVGFRKKMPAASLLAVPLMVAGEATGAIVFAHTTKTHVFTAEHRTQASILAGQLGALIETARLARLAREQRARADAMIESASALYTRLDTENARQGLAERLLSALDAEFVALLELRGGALNMVSSARAENCRASLLLDATSLCHFAEIAGARAAGDYPMIIDLSADEIGLPLATSGQVLLLPLEIHPAPCKVVIYGGPERTFGEQDITLARAIGGVGALAIQNSKLYTTTSAQAMELQQLLDIAKELGTADDLEQFLTRFVRRAAQFLGFRRSFIAPVESDGVFRVRYVSDEGNILPLVIEIPGELLARVTADASVFYTNDARREAAAEEEFLDEFKITQVLTAPLFASDGSLIGMFGVLDRSDGMDIQREDVDRAQALAAQVATALEATRNFHRAEEHRRRAENLMTMALEISSSIRLPELVTSMTCRAMDMLGGRAAALALSRGGVLETVFVQGIGETDKTILRRLNSALTDFTVRFVEPITPGTCADLLTPALATALNWRDLVVARLCGTDGELIGLLCIANRGADLKAIDRTVLQALAGHASVALDNSRLFMRIAQSNSQWIEIFDAISDFIVVHDHNNRVLRVNRSMAEFIGVRPPELLGIGMRALMAMAQDLGPEPCPFCRAENDGDEFLHPILERTYLVSTSRIRASLEEGTQTIHVLKDITDRREAERRYRELFDNIQEGLFFSSPEGRFVEVNDALVRMLGYESRDELLKIDITKELYFDDKVRMSFRRALEENGVLRNYEEALRRKDGSLIHTLQNVLAIYDAQGAVVQYRGLMLDISELKAFQTELQQQRDFTAKILNNTQSLILVADTAGLVSYANNRCYEVGGYARGELVGRRLIELVVPASREMFADALTKTLSGMQVDNLELPLIVANDQGKFSVNLSPMRDEQGQVTSIVVVMTDITDVALLQAKLMQTEKMAAVGQLVSGVAHEVNNPLTAILGFADLLSSQDDISDDAKRDLNIIIAEAQRTKQIVQNLLSFARQTPPQREPLNINDVLRRTLQLRSYDFSSHGIQVTENFEPNMPELVGDTHQLQQVFLNVLNNAYDAVRDTDRQGRIEVSSMVCDGMAQIEFADNGSGIVAVERIFDPFYTTKEVGKGTGLGLSICYGIIREHGGEISAANRTDSTGAVFTVRLPFKQKALATGGSR